MTVNTTATRPFSPRHERCCLPAFVLGCCLLLPGWALADSGQRITTEKQSPPQAESSGPAGEQARRPHWRHPAPPWHRLHPDWRPRWYDDPWQDPYWSDLQRHPGMEQAHREIERVRRHMDRIMRESFRDFDHRRPPGYGPREQRRDISINVTSQPDHYRVIIRVPGGSADNIEVSLEGRQLTISGKQASTHSERDASGRPVFESEQWSQFSHSTSLPGPVKAGSMQTEVDGERMIIRIAKARQG